MKTRYVGLAIFIGILLVGTNECTKAKDNLALRKTAIEEDSKARMLNFQEGMRKGIEVGYIVGRSGQPLEPFMAKVEKDWAEIIRKNYPEAKP